ncbi:alkaline phosphatase D family protein [Polyangium sp. 6x1]|uniref:alkaline phosphatase D family protein n=1 Tax=Polyangium sp. 6x1 TaxID=3042689 RepID=UPI0024821EEB|nr:alkaline phosphatase D family protein [Polyangium sp. 6x1]MDI1447697.1 alkaline phosphatase D family protein [Polyangium sp. 6x1]
MLSRRSFLRATVVTVGAAFVPGCGDDTSNTPSNRELVEGKGYFPQSVASGDPRPKSVVVWTRVVDSEKAGWDLDIELEIALDAAFTKPVSAPIKLQALAAYDNCVKARIVGDPGTTYYYRFVYERDGIYYVSRVGRTKTAPKEDADVPVRFAFVSCQDFVGRYYNTLLALGTEELDFVVHLGDYIYETTGDPSFQTPDAARKVVFRDPASAIELGANGDEKFYAAKSLDNYRDLYRTYRSDLALQAIHEKFPIVPTWDDHEFANDCWGANATYLSGRASELDVARRKAANQAWFEYQPVDYVDDPDFKYDAAAEYPNDIRIYRDFAFGKHVHLVVTDLRSYRPDHLIPEDAFPGAVIFDEATLTASPGGLPGPTVATPYVNIDDAAYAPYKALLAQVAMASGYDVAKIAGNVSVEYINAVVAQVNGGANPPDPPYLTVDPTGKPRGLSYFDLNKVSFYAQIGTRYFVHKDAFDVFSTLRYAADPKTQDVMGETQEAWFLETLTGSTKTWKVWANEFNIVPVQVDLRQIVGIPASVQRRFYMGVEGWDGFRDKRNELLGKIGGLGNVVALTGDLHTFMTGTPWAEQDPSKKIVEFMTGGVSSTPFRDELTSQVKSDPVLSQIPAAPLLALQIDDLVLDTETKVNPHLAHAESNTHGYAVAEVSAEEIVVTLHSISGKEVTTSYAGKTAEFVAKMKKARFKTVAGGSDLFKEIDGAWKRWDSETLMWV